MSNIESLEQILFSRGFDDSTRRAIRNAKVCLIDDKVDDLKSLVESLKSEGFTNLVEISEVKSANDIISAGFDLIVLDLTGVAKERYSDDGIGLLEHLKSDAPYIPVIIVSGSRPRPDKTPILAKADLHLTKPVKPSDLAKDAEHLLKFKKDPYWGALATLQELTALEPKLSQLGLLQKLRLWWLRRALENQIKTGSGDVVSALGKIAGILAPMGSLALKVVQIWKALKN